MGDINLIIFTFMMFAKEKFHWVPGCVIIGAILSIAAGAVPFVPLLALPTYLFAGFIAGVALVGVLSAIDTYKLYKKD